MLLNLSESPEIREKIAGAVNAEFDSFEDDFMKVATEDQKKELLAWLQQSK